MPYYPRSYYPTGYYTPGYSPSGTVASGVGAGYYPGGYYPGSYYVGSYYPKTLAGPPAPAPTIRAALIAALKADATVAGLVGVRVMPGIITEKTLKPAVAVHLLNDSPGRNLSGPDGTSTARVQFTSVSKLLTDDEAVAEAVRNLADGLLNANLGGLPILFAILDPEADDYTDVGDGTGRAVIRTTMTYLIRYRKPKPVRA